MMLHDRIQEKLQEKGLKQADIARATGKSTVAVSKWLSGQNTPKTESLVKIAKMLGVTPTWLATGQGEMSLPIETSNAQLSNKTFAVWSDGDEPPDGMIPISYLNTVVASMGHGYMNDEPNEETKLWFRQETIASCNVNPEFAKAITVRGESMLPELTEGQVIAIDTSAKRIFDGEIYAFRVGDELKIKYLFKHGDGFKAVSRNDDKLRFPDEYYTAQDIEANNIEIIGQFWWKSETRRVRR